MNLPLRILGMTLCILSAQPALAEYGQPAPYGAGAGSYPFMGGNYGYGQQQGMGMGMGMGGVGSGGGASYQSKSDANELKEAGPEYTKQISENASKAFEASAASSEKMIEQMNSSQPEEVAVSEANVKAAEELTGALDSTGVQSALTKYEKDQIELSKTLTAVIDTQTKAGVAAIQAQSKANLPPTTMAGVISGVANANTNRGGGGLANAVQQSSASGSAVTTPLSQIPNRTPASHNIASDSLKEKPNGVTSFERGMLHNPPSGF